MPKTDLAAMAFGKVYPLYVQKAERKGRTRDEVDQIICWLTGRTPEAVADQAAQGVSFAEFFETSPQLHPNRSKVTGVVCGVRVEEVADPVARNVRRLDKMIEELVRGKPMEKILRS